jgi:F420H(2)-dependent quinone reductase
MDTSLRNRLPAAILRSRLHPLLNGTTLLLGFTGRRSGCAYATPVRYHLNQDAVLVTTEGPWWHNFRGGHPARLWLRGREVAATGEAVADPEQVAQALTAIVGTQPSYGRWVNVRVGPGGQPDPADVRAAVARGRVLIRLRLEQEQGEQ